MIGAGTYLLGAALLAALIASLGFAAVRIRRRLLPAWEGPPAHLVEAIAAIALLTWLAELLGTVGALHGWSIVVAAALLAAVAGRRLPAARRGRREGAGPAWTGRTDRGLLGLVALGAVAVVFAQWGLTAKDALDRGIFNFDSLWYHMPFAAEMAQSHSVTGLHHIETVLVNWFYPQNSELLHAVGILITERDTLSLFLNFGWLAIAFLAAWCVGRPYGRGPHCVVMAAVLLGCHTLVVREPGAAKNDLAAAAPLLAAMAILINAWAERRRAEQRRGNAADGAVALAPGWPLAAAGLAVGLAAGTKLTALAMAAALSLAVIVLARGARRRAAAWWFASAFAGGGYWYVRNLLAAGNPLPQVESLGPLALPHPERLQSGRPDFSIVHYAGDTAVWREFFGPGLDQAFGVLWPLVVGAAVGGALLALLRADRALRWSGAVAAAGVVAYLFTPLSASGAEGEPVGFAINIRFAIPALLAGIVLLPPALARPPAPGPQSAPPPESRVGWGEWALVALALLAMLVSNRADAVLRDPDRGFGLLVAAVAVLVPGALLLARRRGAPRAAVGAVAALAVTAVLALGYPLQRGYLEDRFGPGSGIPGMHLDSAYQWARDVRGARIGLAGTSAGFLQYGFYGTALDNRVIYLGERGPHGAFNAIPSCRGFRDAVNSARLDYLVTAPFLNFIHPDRPVPSPEAGWLRGADAVTPVDRSGPVTVWRISGRLDPGSCGRANAPLTEIPQQPSS